MLKNVIITSLRSIERNRSFSLINMIGLSVSMSLGLLIIVIITEQYSYDNFHREGDQIYRINTRALRVAARNEEYASAPMPLARALKDDYSFTEKVVCINTSLNGDAIYGNVNVPLSGLIVDQDFLNVFNFPLEKGNPANLLKEPNSLVLTQSAAKKIFGEREGLGQTITITGYGEFAVTGILKPFQSKTHLEFEALASMVAFPSMEQQRIVSASTDNWNNYYSNYIYLKLKEGKHIQDVEKALSAISKKVYSNLKLETRDRGYEFYPQALGDITPGPELSNQMGSGMPDMVILFLGVLIGLVMIMACFNYTNLTIAKSLSRAREIGVRKIVGAHRFQVFLQFVGESVVFSMISLAFSYILMQLLKPAFRQLNIAREFSADLQEGYSVYLFFVAFAVLVGCIAGLIPAGYLSAIRPASVLKNTASLKVYGKLTFRKALILTQFTLSIVFIIVVLVIYRQIDFMVHKDYGINERNVLNIRLQGMEFQKIAPEVKKLPGVVSVGGVSHPLGTWADRASDYRRERDEEPFVMRDFIVDDNYITNLDLKFIAGKNFDDAQLGDLERHVILNERALDLFGFKDAVSAIGQTVYVEDSTVLSVIGVVKDFHFRPLNYEIGPLALRFKQTGLGFLSARIVPSQKEAVIASIEVIWKKLDPVHPLQWKMMADEIDDAYTQSGFKDIVKIVGYISFVAVTLACLGMLGMAMYSTQIRIKEIGVRKVMGASSGQITFLLSRAFLTLLAVAAIIGAPAGYFLGGQFLITYPYKAEITPWLILTGISVVGVAGIIMIVSQTWRAATENPVKSLRYE